MDADIVKLLAFSHTVTVLQTHVRLKQLTDADLAAALGGAKASGGTAIWDTVLAMHPDLDSDKATGKFSERIVEFVLLTDGQDQHSTASLADAKAVPAKPGCANMNANILCVGSDTKGKAAVDNWRKE